MIDSLDEKRRFASLMTGLSDYYRQEVSKAVLGLYWEGLRQYDYEAIEKAAWAHTQSPDEAGRWMPKISDIIKLIDGNTADQAALAWSKVDNAVRVRGPWDDVIFDDALIHRVIADMGGWVLICNKDEKEYPFTGKEFQTRYRGYRMRPGTPSYPIKLTGISNAHNEANGQPLLPAVLLGDIEKAKEVARGGIGSNTPKLGAADPLRLG
jgi:hypothetical protein